MPPKMIPDINPEDIKNSGERKVYYALREQLPDNWVVVYHYVYVIKPTWRNESGEVDFIILSPDHGVIFVEVKGSYGYESDQGLWYRIDKQGFRTKMDKSPFEQASNNQFNVIEHIVCKRLRIPKSSFPATYGHVVIYPNGQVGGNLCASHVPNVLFNYFDMGFLYNRLIKAFEDWGAFTRKNFNAITFNKIVEILEGDTKFVPVAATDVESSEKVIDALTKEQYNVFRNILAKQQVLVKGLAGSGKTMLAVWTAQALGSFGSSVLFLCYNKLLAAWIKIKYDLPENVTIKTYHSLCREYSTKSNINFEPNATDGEEHFWKEESANKLVDALNRNNSLVKFDAIVVDEGQDFMPIWWIPLYMLLTDEQKGHFYIFYDPDQRLYSDSQNDSNYPAGMKNYILEKNCRNTKVITKYCGNVISKTLLNFNFSPEGDDPVIYSAIPDTSNRVAKCNQIVNAWLNEGFTPSQIAIISPWNSQNAKSVLGKLGKIAQIPIKGNETDLIDWISEKCIWGSTVKAFKGLEADCILVVDLPECDSNKFSISDMYVAASRAKHRLAILPVSIKAHKNAMDWLKTQS